MDPRADIRRPWRRFTGWFNSLALTENTVLLLFGLGVGALSALGVVAFYSLLDAAFGFFFSMPGDSLWGLDVNLLRPLLTGAALVAAWWIMARPGSGHDGLNIPDIQLAVARRGGHVPTRPALARATASAVTIGGGGSAGSEGPVAVLGSTVGSALGRAFDFGSSRVRILTAAGAASAISAAFNAPLAGAFFALEQILGSLAVDAFAPVVVGSVTAGVISHAFYGASPAFAVPVGHAPASGLEVLVFFPLLGVVAALVGVLFVRVYFGTQDLVERVKAPPLLVAAVGGAIVGGLVLLSSGRLVAAGHFSFPVGLFGGLAWWLLLLLAGGKILATALTLSAGGSGGIFTPCLYVGAATGGAFGTLLGRVLPGVPVSPGLYGLVGMGAVVVAATDAPLTAVLLVFELTGDYGIVLPLMLTAVIAHLVARHLEPDSVYRGWLRRRGENIEQGTDRDVLARIRVRDAFDPDPTVSGEDASVGDLLSHLEPGTQSDFPVVNRELEVVGMISVAELGRVARDHRQLGDMLIAADLANPVDPVRPGDSVLTAIRAMGVRGLSSLPVVDATSGKLMGTIGREDILAAYETAVAGAAESEQQDGGSDRMERVGRMSDPTGPTRRSEVLETRERTEGT